MRSVCPYFIYFGITEKACLPKLDSILSQSRCPTQQLKFCNREPVCWSLFIKPYHASINTFLCCPAYYWVSSEVCSHVYLHLGNYLLASAAFLLASILSTIFWLLQYILSSCPLLFFTVSIFLCSMFFAICSSYFM